MVDAVYRLTPQDNYSTHKELERDSTSHMQSRVDYEMYVVHNVEASQGSEPLCLGAGEEHLSRSGR